MELQLVYNPVTLVLAVDNRSVAYGEPNGIPTAIW